MSDTPLLPSGDPISRPICGSALRKKPGKICNSTILLTNGRCRLHGGKSPAGIASASFKHGRYSAYLPDNLRQQYLSALTDPTVKELGDEIALVNMHIEERLQKLTAGETSDKWNVLLSIIGDMDVAIDELDPDIAVKIKRLSGVLRSTARQGVREFKRYEAIQPMIEQKRKLVESEAKRLKDLGQNIPLGQVIGLIAQAGHIIKKHVTDPDQLAAISRELNELVN